MEVTENLLSVANTRCHQNLTQKRLVNGGCMMIKGKSNNRACSLRSSSTCGIKSQAALL